MANRFNLSMSELHVMSTDVNHETSTPGRSEPSKLLKPTTLPHENVSPDTTNSGQGELMPEPEIKLEVIKPNEPPSETISLSELRRNWSQSQTQFYEQEPRGGCFSVFMIALRLTFYLAVIAISIFLTLAVCKFTNAWDPCQYLYVNTTECKVTSYLKGMLYHKDCTEEHFCILPGFTSNTQVQVWTLEKPTGPNEFENSNVTEYETAAAPT